MLYAGNSTMSSTSTRSVILRSRDGGQSWTSAPSGYPAEHSFGPSPYLTSISVSSRGNVHAVIGSTFCGDRAAIYQSTDAGRTWGFLGGPDWIVGESLVAPWNHKRILAIAESESDCRSLYGPSNKLYESRDGGGTWQEARLDGIEYFNSIVAADGPSRTLYAVAKSEDGASVLFRSTGDQQPWQRLEPLGLQGRFHAVQVHPLDHDLLCTWSVSGVYCSKDGGSSWLDTGFPIQRRRDVSLAFALDGSRKLYALDAKQGVLYVGTYR